LSNSLLDDCLGAITWCLLSKLKDAESRKRYAERAIQYGWSRNVLNIHIETRLLEREGKAVTNFEVNLPKPGSDLAHQALKDSYVFDFLGVGQEADEREIETAMVQHITRFLIELGAGFAFVGRQYQLVEALSPELKTSLPSIEQIEQELGDLS